MFTLKDGRLRWCHGQIDENAELASGNKPMEEDPVARFMVFGNEEDKHLERTVGSHCKILLQEPVAADVNNA
jgi:hypothetical protein